MSELLKQFYREYRDWLLNDAPVKNKFDFTRSSGLCVNYHSYIFAHGIMNNLVLVQELDQQFTDAGLCNLIPFNRKREGDVSYMIEAETGTCHLNKKRREWVFTHAE